MGDYLAPALAGRRQLLAGLAAGVAAAVTSCSAPLGAGHGTSGSPTAGPPESAGTTDAGRHGTAGAAEPGHAVPETPPPSPAAPACLPPTKEQVVAEFAGRRPVEWGLGVTGVVTRSAAQQVVLTLDACGGPGGSGVDSELLALLRHDGVPATLFVNARWIQANPGLATELGHDPLFELANHGWAHRPLSVVGNSAYRIPGTGSVAEAYDELTGCLELLRSASGREPRFFRSGTAHLDEVAAAMARRLGMLPVNFSVNADGGATLGSQAVAAALDGVRPGDIVIAHFNKPGSGTCPGFRQALPRLLGGGTAFARLGDVLPPL